MSQAEPSGWENIPQRHGARRNAWSLANVVDHLRLVFGLAPVALAAFAHQSVARLSECATLFHP